MAQSIYQQQQHQRFMCRHVFSVGVSNYGVADCELLAQDTHKFESRYLDSLIGYGTKHFGSIQTMRAQPHGDSPDRRHSVLIMRLTWQCLCYLCYYCQSVNIC